MSRRSRQPAGRPKQRLLPLALSATHRHRASSVPDETSRGYHSMRVNPARGGPGRAGADRAGPPVNRNTSTDC
jgi:hypothetical protein